MHRHIPVELEVGYVSTPASEISSGYQYSLLDEMLRTTSRVSTSSELHKTFPIDGDSSSTVSVVLEKL